MSSGGGDLARQYAAALHGAIADPGEEALSAAYDLGRSAVRAGLSVLELAAIHHEALTRALSDASDGSAAERVAQAAGAFFLESVSAYEMLERVLRESQERARLEQRQTTLLRRLSGFLGDASLAGDANASTLEVLHLVAEHALDFVDAVACRAWLGGPAGPERSGFEAVASSGRAGVPDAGVMRRLAELHDSLGPGETIRLAPGAVDGYLPGARFAWLAAPLMALDGRTLGGLHLYGGAEDFSMVDEAVTAQLADIASATFERMELYRR